MTSAAKDGSATITQIKICDNQYLYLQNVFKNLGVWS